MTNLVSTIPDWYYKATKAGRADAAAAAVVRLTRRRAVATELEQLRADQLAAATVGQAKRSEARAAVKALEKQLEQAKKAESAVTAADRTEQLKFDDKIASGERELRSTAEPAIAVFIDELRAELDAVRGRGIESALVDVDERPGYEPVARRVNNRASVHAYIAGNMKAQQLAADVQLEALDHDQILGRLAKIRQGIPVVAAAAA